MKTELEEYNEWLAHFGGVRESYESMDPGYLASFVAKPGFYQATAERIAELEAMAQAKAGAA